MRAIFADSFYFLALWNPQDRGHAQALAFTNKVGELAEAEDHHPAILTEWGLVTVTWWTHKVKGLHRNDLIMASKTDAAYKGMSTREKKAI